MKKIIFFLLITVSSFCQTQIGIDINGEVGNDYSGASGLSFSSDGTVVAIGAIGNDGNGADSGHVRVFQNIANIWTQVGADINGEAAGDASGVSVSLSGDGNILAIGAYSNDGNGSNSGHVRVFQNIANVWTQIGADINGEAANDRCGHNVSLSDDGTVLIAGAYNNDGNGTNSGHVRVYKNIANVWTQIGADINGESLSDSFGVSSATSSDGNIIAIGAIGNDGNGADSGHVRVFQNIANVWTQIGADINGETVGDNSGRVALSSDGTIVAIGANGNDGNGLTSGHVRVYQNIANVWTQIGADINGEAASDNSGISVSLSSNGNVLAIGAYANSGSGSNSGHCRIYKNISGTWTQIGVDIDGEATGDNCGNTVSLSSNATILAIGASGNNGNGSDSGHVRVYDITSILSNSEFNISNNFSIFPNPTISEININFKEFTEASTLEIYDINSRLLKTETLKNINNTINIENLQTGLYLFKIISINGSTISKIQKN